jgi:hypothetical protein
MYNLSQGSPHKLKVNNNKGSPQKEEKINKKKDGGAERRRVKWSGWIYAFTRSNAGSHPCPPHN